VCAHPLGRPVLGKQSKKATTSIDNAGADAEWSELLVLFHKKEGVPCVHVRATALWSRQWSPPTGCVPACLCAGVMTPVVRFGVRNDNVIKDADIGYVEVPLVRLGVVPGVLRGDGDALLCVRARACFLTGQLSPC